MVRSHGHLRCRPSIENTDQRSTLEIKRTHTKEDSMLLEHIGRDAVCTVDQVVFSSIQMFRSRRF